MSSDHGGKQKEMVQMWCRRADCSRALWM